MKKVFLKICSLLMVLPVVLTCASCSAAFKKDADALLELEFTDFPTKAYDADKVHPVRNTGTLSGQEAVDELNLIEWEYIRHYVDDNYIAARWCFKDPEAYGLITDKPSYGKVFPGDIVGLAGNSGRSSAAHLHFEIRYGEVNIDPCTIIDFPHWSLRPGVNKFSMKKAKADHRKIQAKLRNNNYYIVKKGDSQGDVANWFNISIESLCRINNLKPGAPLKDGQKLRGSK